MRLPTRVTVVTALLALTAAGLTACGSSGGGGATSSTPAASSDAPTAALTGGSTAVALSGSFLSTLSRLGLAPTATSPATLTGGTVTFPITGGTATVSGSTLSGAVQHSGGIALTTRGQKVQLEEFVLALGAKPTLTGKVLVNGSALGSTGITMFDLDTSTMSAPVTAGGTTTLSGATVYVDASAAVALNAAFGLSNTAKALPTGADAVKVGTATITLKR